MWVKSFVRRLVRLLVNNFRTFIYPGWNQGCKIKYMDTKSTRRQRIKYGVRKKISGTSGRPRLSVFRSNNEIYVQLIDDDSAKTLASASSKDKDILAQKGSKVEKSKLVGAAIARKATDLGLLDVIFDRSGYLYHGRVKAVAEGAREGGLKF